MTALDVRGLPSALFGSAVGTQSRFAAQDAAIRSALSTTRRIGFVSLSPEPAVTALALQATRTIAARRVEPVLAVDATTDGAFARALGAEPTPPSEARAAARTTAEALTGLVEREGVVTLHPPLDDGAVGMWLAEAAPITRFFDIAVTDFGAHHPLADLGSCAALCDIVCVVSSADRASTEQARSVLPAIADLPEAPRPVLALVSATGDGAAVARAVRSATPHPVLAIPSDTGLRSAGAPRSLAARRALLSLAAVLVTGAEVHA
ncbi:hypothetical protein ACTU3I_03325 [Microbacterium sp. RD1]|uniref:hypothetical protein n=1 Tax=Microbacterium sp. RD1 TaxID=3457313 RepID=UPI003FA58B0D